MEKAFEIFNEADTLTHIKIEKVGATVEGKEINGGDSGLDRLKEFMRTNPDFLTRPTMLIYDCDVQKKDEDIGMLSVRGLKQMDKPGNKKGIENLLPTEIFLMDEGEFLSDFGVERGRFWTTKMVEKDYGIIDPSRSFDKIKFTRWFCENIADESTMKDFQPIVQMIKDFVFK